MKRVMLHGVEDLRVEDTERDDLWSTGVRIDIKYTGICGSDLHEYSHGPISIRAEEHDHTIPKSEWNHHLPKAMGHEISGIVAETGEDVGGINPGDRVTVNTTAPCRECRYCQEGDYNLCERFTGVVSTAGFADEIVVPDYTVVPVPDDVTLKQAALTEPLAVSLRGVRQAKTRPGDVVAVFGAGPIGLGVIDVAYATGARDIFVSEPRSSRRAIATDLGADEVFDPTQTDAIQYIQGAAGSVDVSFETAGAESALTAALRATKYGGTVAIVSVFEDRVSIHPNDIGQAERNLIGSFGYMGGPIVDRSEFPMVLTMIADGRLTPAAQISDVVGLSDIQDAFEQLRNPNSEHVKILVEP